MTKAALDETLLTLFNAMRWLTMTQRVRDRAATVVAITILNDAARRVMKGDA